MLYSSASEIMIKFGEKVKLYRNLAGLTQEQLAEKCDCSAQTISGTETGYSFPCSKILFKISFALNIPLAYLFNFGEDKQELINETASIIAGYVEKMTDEQKRIVFKMIQSVVE